MRRDVLDQAGGLGAFAQYIAEDYFMAKAIADRYAHIYFTSQSYPPPQPGPGCGGTCLTNESHAHWILHQGIQ